MPVGTTALILGAASLAGSIGSSLIAKGGAGAGGAQSAAAGQQAYQQAQNTALSNRRASAAYTSAGYGATNELLKALGLGHLNPMSVGADNNGASYGDTSLNQDSREGDRTDALNSFQASPGYNFRVSEGTRALDQSAASKGMLLSGAQAKGVTDYGQQQGSQEWGNYINSLMGLSGQGASVTNATNAANTNALTGGANGALQGGLAQGSATASGSNALASGIGSGVNGLASLYAYNGSGGGGGYTVGSAPIGGYTPNYLRSVPGGMAGFGNQ